MEAEADQQQAWLIGNDNVVLILLAITLLTVTLSRLCLVAVWFYIIFIRFLFYVRCMKYYQYCNHVKICWYQLYTNLAYVPPTYQRINDYEFS